VTSWGGSSASLALKGGGLGGQEDAIREYRDKRVIVRGNVCTCRREQGYSLALRSKGPSTNGGVRDGMLVFPGLFRVEWGGGYS